MKNNQTKIIIGAIILVIVIIVGILYQNDATSDKSLETTEETSEESGELSITTTIDNGTTEMSYDKKVSSGTSALDLINLISEQDGIVVGTTEYDFGIIVDSIDSIGEDTKDGKFWSFYVNDEMSMVGVSDYIVADNDQILMKYQVL